MWMKMCRNVINGIIKINKNNDINEEGGMRNWWKYEVVEKFLFIFFWKWNYFKNWLIFKTEI